jgi:drug/metabolite transporter (DMT)-like permease
MRKRLFTATGVEALIVAAFFYAGTNGLVRYMSPMWGDQAQVFARFAVAALVLFVINYFRKKKIGKALKGRIRLVIILSILQALAILFYTLAVQETTIANMLFVSYATVMITQFLLGTVVLKETVNRTKLWAMALSFIGLVLYTHSFISGDSGILFSILAGVTGSFVNLIYKKLAHVDRGVVLQVQYGLGAIFLLGITFALGGDFVRTVSLMGILITIAFAITILIASYLLLYGYRHVDVNIGTVLSSTELVFGVALGLLLFSEVPTGWEISSGILITTAAIIGALGQKSVARERFRLGR